MLLSVVCLSLLMTYTTCPTVAPAAILDSAAAMLDDVSSPIKCGASMKSVCKGRLAQQMKSPALMKGAIFAQSLCYCDSQCHVFRDCCADAADLSTPDDVTRLVSGIPRRMWRCDKLNVYPPPPQNPTSYMVSRCPPGHMLASKCSGSGDYIQDIPRMEALSRVWFRNVYCAVCHGMSNNLTTMNTSIQCSSAAINSTEEFYKLVRNATYGPKALHWEWIDDNNKTMSCYLRVSSEQWDANNTFHRPCVRSIDTCHETWDNVTVATRCGQFSDVIQKSSMNSTSHEVYKNHFCAACNAVPASELKCWGPKKSSQTAATFVNVRQVYTPPSLSLVLFRAPRESACVLPHGIYDAIRDSCELFTSICSPGYSYRDNKCLYIEDTSDERSSNYTLYDVNATRNFSCPKSVLDKTEFRILADRSLMLTLKSSERNRMFAEGSYELLDDGSARVCKILRSTPPALMYSSKAEGVLTAVCLSVSIVCLVLHIIVYSSLPRLRNLPGKNLLALSWALLVAQLAFLFGVHPMTSVPHGACVTLAIVVHYFYLSAFCWMNVMSFDIWRKFSSTLQQNSTPANLHRKYAAYAWGAPAVVVTLALVAHLTPLLPTDARPNYGQDNTCWFGTRLGMVIFITVPVGITLISNLGFFGVTVFKILRQKQESSNYIRDSTRVELVQTKNRTSVNSPDKEDPATVKVTVTGPRDPVHVYLYVKLFTIMGLTWLFGFVAALADVPVLWYPFIVLNGLQGCLVFIMFDCKRAVAAAMWDKAVGDRYSKPSYLQTKKSCVTVTSSSSQKTNRTSVLSLSDVTNDKEQVRSRLCAVVHDDIEEERNDVDDRRNKILVT